MEVIMESRMQSGTCVVGACCFSEEMGEISQRGTVLLAHVVLVKK